ncbi:MAG: transporter substrate-binding domain-containing protein [Spirochaetales bacterium]|nr:transporter substrate-binding domain-containing protein [Spirochaetales bacterium]
MGLPELKRFASIFFLTLIVIRISAQVQDKTLIAGVLKDFPPQYSLDEEGQLQGFAIDVMDKLARLSGVGMEYRLFDSWVDLHDALYIGEIDLIPNMGITDRRLNDYSYSLPTETFPIVIITRRSDESIQSLEELSGKRTAVVRLNVGEVLVANAPGAIVQVYENPEDAFFHLLSGQADAMIYPGPVIYSMAREIGLEKRITFSDRPLLEIKRAIGVKKGNEEIIQLFNPVIEEFVGSEGYRTIYSRWYGNENSFWDVKRVVVFMTSLLVLSSFSLIFWKYVTTDKLVKKRTAELDYQVQLLNQVGDGIISTDLEGYITSWNPGASSLFGYKTDEISGSSLDRLFKDYDRDRISGELFFSIQAGEDIRQLDAVLLRKTDSPFEGIVSLTVLLDRKGEKIGYICLIKDITERKKMEQNREKLIQELQDALKRIKTLSGLVPICASCKKIRDDSGYWNQLEEYLIEHSDVSFSHGICPECAEKLYGYKAPEKDK